MPTIAELQINVNTKQISDARTELDNFRSAADKAKDAAKGFNDAGKGSNTRNNTKDVKDLSSAIDLQTRKLKELADQRKKLEESGLKSTMPAEYARLNTIIEANIALVTRQGNAVSQLSDAQARDAKKIADEVARKAAAQARADRAAASSQNALSNAAARQQREIEAVINGLSRQIKAQNDYNREVEKLNQARALSGMGGAGTNTISAEEYDSYLKLAAAKRDAALATKDNSREVELARSKLDAYVGRLNATERAQLEFARASRTAADALSAGAITQDMYNQRMQQFTAHRDAAIAKANDNTAAEQRFARQLREVQSAFDPVARAQDQYNNAVKILSDGLTRGVLSADAFNRSLSEQVKALDQVKAASNPNAKIGQQYEDALRAVLPYRTELANLARQQQALDQAKNAGHVVTQQQIKDYEAASKAIKDQTDFYNRRIEASTKNTISAKQEAAALRGLPAQFTDIFVSLQGGQAPLTVLFQQGGQIKDMFGGIGNALKAMGNYLLGMINPVSVVVTALAAIGFTMNAGAKEAIAFNRALIAGANASGVAASQFGTYRDQISDVVGTSGQAAEALTAMAASGKIAGENFVGIGTAAVKMQRATGQAISQTVADFASLGKDPVNAAVSLDEKYKFLNSSILATADALIRQGKQQEAVIMLQDEMQKSVNQFADVTIAQAGLVEVAWVNVKKAVAGTWDFIKNIGRDTPLDTQITKLNADIKALESVPNGGWEDRIAILKDQVAGLEQQKKANEANAEAERKLNEERERGVRISKENIASLEANKAAISAVAGAQAQVDKIMRQGEELRRGAALAGRELSKADIENQDIALKAAQARLERAKEAEARSKKPKTSSINNNNFNEERSELRKIEAEYDRYYKNVTALGKAGVTSSAATAASQRAILMKEREAVAGSYDEQIDALKKLQGNKKNNATQNIQLNNQMTKVEEQRAVALEKLDSRLENLDIAEKARIEARKNSLREYKAALDATLNATIESGERDAVGVGHGNRQKALNESLYDNDKSYSKARLSLANSLSENKIDTEQYNERLAALTENHTKMSDAIIANDARVTEAQKDWRNGFNSALENASDNAQNIAGLVDNALTGAFDKAGEALANFTTTGKFNFKSFATSIISDMARIAAKQASSAALSTLLKIGVTAASAYFGGGTTTTSGVTSTTGGTSFGQIGSSYTGTGVFTNSHGGAYSGGKKYFAKGGAFTNSVVSSQTNFGMAGGASGVMGEAGPEAIVPLARTRDGNLGVRMMGGNDDSSGSGTNVQVIVNVTESGTQSTATGDGADPYKGMGDKIGQLVRTEVYTIINKETRPGGSLKGQ